MAHIMLFPMINVFHFYSNISWSMCTVPRNSRFIVHWCLLSMYVSQVFSEWFSDGSSCPYYYWYLFCFYTPHALFFYYISVFSNLFAIFLHRISVPSHCTINIHVPFSLSRIMMSGLLLGMVLSVCACLVTLISWLVSTDCVAWS